MVDTLDYYNDNAEELSRVYRSLDPEKVHAHWQKHLPEVPGRALDVGAGSGRDAAWLARKGWQVVAVEPATEMLRIGEKATASLAVTWVVDSLPKLAKLKKSGHRFSCILAGAVLMHLSPPQQYESLVTLASFLEKGGVLVVTLRHGPDAAGRSFFPVSREEICQFASRKSMQIAVLVDNKDKLGRTDVIWQTIVLWKNCERELY
jgi:2-polyprenyl-3-methyl-5-hydroxy-6-metoxy-1,4-benzoquinol methylase